MGRAILQACSPWVALLVVSFVVLYLLVRFSRARIRPGRLGELHRDQAGSVQSLSFVLTLPLFVMVMLFIVQVSQLMIATVVVHYAAYATARSAVVWIPAEMGLPEEANCISAYYPDFPDPDADDQVPPILDPDDPNYGPADGGMTFVVAPGSPKYEKIVSAAWMACMPICPSRDLGVAPSGGGPLAVDIIHRAYEQFVPQSSSNARIPARLQNKLAYAMSQTQVEIRFYHKNREPPLVTYFRPPDEAGFRFNELGWQDPITVTVKHNLALLPGPGRLLARAAPRPGRVDEVSQETEKLDNVYTYPLKATIMMANEGEKSVIPYVYQAY